MDILDLDILRGEEDAFIGSLLPTTIYVTECMEKKKEKLKESERLAFIPLIDAVTDGIRKRFGNIMGIEKVIASSILLPKFEDTWTEDNFQLQKGKL